MKKLLFILLFCIQALQAQNLQTFLNDPALRHAQISFELRDLATGKTVASHNAQTACTPASVTKSITTAAALETLGADFRFETKLAADGEIDKDGALQGNLYIIGGGDPTLGSRYFSNSDFVPAWIEAIRKAGIKKINGSVLVDTKLYDQNPVPVLWLREDAGNYYAAGVFPLSVFDNSYEITLKSAANSVEISKKPDYYSFKNFLKIGTKDSIYISGEPYSQERTIYGTIRPNQSKTVKGDISNPPMFLAQYFSEKLQENDIFVNSEKIETDGEIKIIHSHFSPSLKNIATMTNTFSINNYAEHLLKYLALQRDTIGTFNGALQYQRDFWTSKGIDMSGVFLYDGSGLSPSNAFPAAFVCDVLAYMKAKNFEDALPTAGVNGTVSAFLANTPLKGKARVKSGSFRNVQCYAGYISQNKKDYAFCIMVNNFTGERKNVMKLIEQLLVNSLSMTDNR